MPISKRRFLNSILGSVLGIALGALACSVPASAGSVATPATAKAAGDPDDGEVIRLFVECAGERIAEPLIMGPKCDEVIARGLWAAYQFWSPPQAGG
jgi:hypothetical protein